MNNTRIGKIARLPKVVREVLGDRLEAGEKAGVLLPWLNGLECVQAVLQEYFGSRLITEQNLSEWRQGGHQDWLRQEQAQVLIGKLTEQGRDLDWAAQGLIGDRLGRRVAVELVRLAEILVEQEADPRKRWEQLCEVNRELSKLRREDHRAAQMELHRQRFEFQVARANKEKYRLPRPGDGDLRDSPSCSQFELDCLESQTRENHARTRPEFRKPFVPVVEPGENFKIQTPNLRENSSSKAPAETVASPAESGQIQPNPTKSNLSENSASQRPAVTEPGEIAEIQKIDGRNEGEGWENSKIRNPNFGEDSSSKAQVVVAGQIEPAESGQIQPNPTKSNLSSEAEEKRGVGPP